MDFMKAYFLSLYLFSIAFLGGCGEIPTSTAESEIEKLAKVDSFRIQNAEIRQDIINELVFEEIEHWINTDTSIGFNLRDAEKFDAIGYRAIGAYAARN